MSKNILSLKPDEAKNFLLKSESYCNLNLPIYFNFDELLKTLGKKLKGKEYPAFLKDRKNLNPSDMENINYNLFHNKNGKYEWRKFELIHPVLYILLVNEITKYKNWKFIKKRFGKIIGKSSIQCVSLPIISDSKKSDKAEQILNWWDNVEQKSLSLSLDFNYVYHTDITDCYGAIYTHSIPWSLHTKKTAKTKTFRNNKKAIGNAIDNHLQAMSYGQTNGIPQGSVLMDFIAEIVLFYADELLTERLKKTINKKEYKIIRYRDDYRIFVNKPSIGEFIIKNLTEVLISLGLKLHPHKTALSDNIIQGSIKKDKLEWLKTPNSFTTLQKELISIHDFSLKFPNSGTLEKELLSILKKLKKETKNSKVRKQFVKFQNIESMIGIITNIAFYNPRTYSVTSALISSLLVLIDNKSDILNILSKIQNKFQDIPNTGHMDIWLQRITIKFNFIDFSSSEKLCKLVNKEKTEIWENKWLQKDLIKIIENTPIIDENELRKVKKTIGIKEISIFDY